jgi:folate-dependent phosphoribosylglycinamide formyltransferase PurN
VYKIGWFTTGRGTGSQGLLKAVRDAIESGDLKVQLAFVFLSREPGEASQTDRFIEQVKSYSIPLEYLSYQKYKARYGTTEGEEADSLPQWRLEYDRRVMDLLKDYQTDICVLAGFMLIVGAEVCIAYKMINLHPAAPGGPTGTWREVIWQLIDTQASETGVMMHLVTPQLDKGPVVTYATFSIRGEPFDSLWRQVDGRTSADIKTTEGEANALFKLIRQYGMARELPLLIATIKAFSQGRVKVSNGLVLDGQGKPVNGYNLTNEIEQRLKETP